MRFEDMTYDEQRAFLGLWRPPFSFHWERLGRGLKDAFGPVSALLNMRRADVELAYNYGLAHDYALARGDK